MADFHVNDVGTVFRATIPQQDGVTPLDVSSATTLKMWFTLPDQTGFERTAVKFTDGTDGRVQYTTVFGDLSLPGNWKVQAVAYFGPAEPVHADVHKFKVVANLRQDPTP